MLRALSSGLASRLERRGYAFGRFKRSVVNCALIDRFLDVPGSQDDDHTRVREAGFTLVEVVVAVAILSTVLTVLLPVLSDGLRNTFRAERMATAGSLAQSLLAEVGSEWPIAEGQTSGRFPNGFRWRLTTQRFGDATERQIWPAGAYRVLVEVLWDDGPQERSYALSTLRLGFSDASR